MKNIPILAVLLTLNLLFVESETQACSFDSAPIGCVENYLKSKNPQVIKAFDFFAAANADCDYSEIDEATLYLRNALQLPLWDKTNGQEDPINCRLHELVLTQFEEFCVGDMPWTWEKVMAYIMIKKDIFK
jgi:hypothetical protein